MVYDLITGLMQQVHASTEGDPIRGDSQCLQAVLLQRRESGSNFEKVLTNERLPSCQSDLPDSQSLHKQS